MKKKLFGISIDDFKKKDILEKIKMGISQHDQFFHLVSLNPENLVIAQKNTRFKKVVKTAQIRIIDGVGVVLACRLLGIKYGEKVPGVDLMEELLTMAGELCLRVLFIGGKGNLANNLVDCYQKKFPKAKFFGLEGIKDIKNPKKEEEEKIFSIVSDFKPHLVFVAFGSPDQELWIEHHKNKFNRCVIMGVGGGFDFLGGRVPRAPAFIRRLGFEWLFRLFVQPWRWRRQLRLVEFVWLVGKEWIKRLSVKSVVS